MTASTSSITTKHQYKYIHGAYPEREQWTLCLYLEGQMGQVDPVVPDAHYHLEYLETLGDQVGHEVQEIL